MRYIVITEEGETYQADTIDNNIKEACDAGIMDCIDTEAIPKSKKYFEGEWFELRVWGNF